MVYLNGMEIFRSNMTNGPAVPVLFNHFATDAGDTNAESAFYSGTTNASALVPGDNMLAVAHLL